MISKATLGRLPLYLQFIRSLPDSVSHISATTISRRLGLGEVQVRKDLATISKTGRPKLGYRTDELVQCLEKRLFGNHNKEAVIVGAGKLGMALLDYTGFQDYGLTVRRAFDTDCAKLNERVLPFSEFASYCALHQIEIGIITVPKETAQIVANEMVKCGIQAIWCFSVAELILPQSVSVQYENLALSLAHLQMKVNNTQT